MKNYAIVQNYDRKKHTIKYYAYDNNRWYGYDEFGKLTYTKIDDHLIFHWLREDLVILSDSAPDLNRKRLYCRDGNLYLHLGLRWRNCCIQYSIQNGLKTTYHDGDWVFADADEVICIEQKQKLLELMGEE